ncbi:UNVERIFIED_CONTAM: UDP-glycosyltransferase 89A2 [Sesamum radiatum]|uniref:UDP-glycosyltransferase 89A2 n=1 Tax=Sesamum radiatum TaxID=300843 RepID=A0AAW2TW05_SESRA
MAIAAGCNDIGWPMEADQFLNAKLLVEYKGAAVQVCEGGDTVPDTAAGSKDSRVMNGDTVGRVRAKELRNKALEAIKVGGSSTRDLDGLVEELAKLQVTNA